jgi:hypothetical protein
MGEDRQSKLDVDTRSVSRTSPFAIGAWGTTSFDPLGIRSEYVTSSHPPLYFNIPFASTVLTGYTVPEVEKRVSAVPKHLEANLSRILPIAIDNVGGLEQLSQFLRDALVLFNLIYITLSYPVDHSTPPVVAN